MRLLACLIILSFLFLGNAASALPIYKGKAEIRRYKISVDVTKINNALSKFGKAVKFFGAVAVDESGERMFPVSGLNSVDEASKLALEMCKINSSIAKLKTKCHLYAIAVPKGYKGDETISEVVRKPFEEYQSKQKPGKYGAFAVSRGMSVFGRSWGYPSKRAAESRAVRECEKSILTDGYGVPIGSTRNLEGYVGLLYRANEKLNYNKCRIVHTISAS